MTPTPSAPTAEMLAQEAKRLLHKALRDAEGGRDEWIRQHDTAIDRLAALAPSEPPTGEPVPVVGIPTTLESSTPTISDERIEALMTKIQAFGLACWGHETCHVGMQGEISADLRALLAEARAPGAVPERKSLVFRYRTDPETGEVLSAAAPPIEAQAGEPTTLRLFLGAAFPCSIDIDPRGYRWSEAYLDQALAEAQAEQSQAVASRIDAVDSVQEPKP